MTLTPEKLDELERLAELATPGPWELKDGRTDTIENAQGYPVCTVHWYPNERYGHGTRAAYIAALDPATVRELVRAARERDHQAARIAEREKPCVWTPEGEDSSSWNTGCGSSFWFDDGHEGVNFCPFCGHPAVFDHEGDSA